MLRSSVVSSKYLIMNWLLNQRKTASDATTNSPSGAERKGHPPPVTRAYRYDRYNFLKHSVNPAFQKSISAITTNPQPNTTTPRPQTPSSQVCTYVNLYLTNSSICKRFSSTTFLFPFFLKYFLKLLFLPLPLAFSFSFFNGSSALRSRSCSFLR